jgi:hypothetical protein
MPNLVVIREMLAPDISQERFGCLDRADESALLKNGKELAFEPNVPLGKGGSHGLCGRKLEAADGILVVRLYDLPDSLACTDAVLIGKILQSRQEEVAEPEVFKNDLDVPRCESRIGRCGIATWRHAVEPGTAAVTRMSRTNDVGDLFFHVGLCGLERLHQ